MGAVWAGSLESLPVNMRQGLKKSPGTNVQAYLCTAPVTQGEKSFVALVTGLVVLAGLSRLSRIRKYLDLERVL